MQDKAEAMVLSSFAADSPALGAHWIYDVGEIDRRFGRVEGLLKPLANSYRATKDLGEFTHYGDQRTSILQISRKKFAGRTIPNRCRCFQPVP